MGKRNIFHLCLAIGFCLFLFQNCSGSFVTTVTPVSSIGNTSDTVAPVEISFDFNYPQVTGPSKPVLDLIADGSSVVMATSNQLIKVNTVTKKVEHTMSWQLPEDNKLTLGNTWGHKLLLTTENSAKSIKQIWHIDFVHSTQKLICSNCRASPVLRLGVVLFQDQDGKIWLWDEKTEQVLATTLLELPEFDSDLEPLLGKDFPDLAFFVSEQQLWSLRVIQNQVAVKPLGPLSSLYSCGSLVVISSGKTYMRLEKSSLGEPILNPARGLSSDWYVIPSSVVPYCLARTSRSFGLGGPLAEWLAIDSSLGISSLFTEATSYEGVSQSGEVRKDSLAVSEFLSQSYHGPSKGIITSLKLIDLVTGKVSLDISSLSSLKIKKTLFVSQDLSSWLGASDEALVLLDKSGKTMREWPTANIKDLPFSRLSEGFILGDQLWNDSLQDFSKLQWQDELGNPLKLNTETFDHFSQLPQANIIEVQGVGFFAVNLQKQTATILHLSVR